MNSSFLISIVLMMAVSCFVSMIAADPAGDSSSASALDQLTSTDYIVSSPKRQSFLIGPRIGRSVWPSSLEGGYPEGRQSPLFLLVGSNPRHTIGGRSSSSMGYMPQARIGRRASPMGLMPMPRVGRRSDPSLTGSEPTGGEVAIPSVNDSAFNDAIEALVYGAAISSLAGAGPSPAPVQSEQIDMPVHRAPAFVPRLGKRQYSLFSVDGSTPIWSTNQVYSILATALQNSDDRANLASYNNMMNYHQRQEQQQLELPNSADFDVYRHFNEFNYLPVKRNEVAQDLESAWSNRAGGSAKRMPFTPRVG